MAGRNNVEILPLPVRPVLRITSCHLLGGAPSKVIVYCLWPLLLSYCIIHTTSSAVMPGGQLIQRLATSQIPFCTFRALPCLTRDGPVSAEAGSGSPRIGYFAILVSLPCGAGETLEKIDVMAVLYDSALDISLGYMPYCCSRDVYWPRCTSYWFSYCFNMHKGSDVPFCSASSTHLRNENGELINERTVPRSPVLFLPVDLTPVMTVQARLRRWLAEHHQSEVSGSEGPSNFPEVGNLDANAAAHER